MHRPLKLCAAATFTLLAWAQAPAKLELKPMAPNQGYMPVGLKLSETRPQGITQEPAYTGKPPRTDTNGPADLVAPVGTRVTLTARLNKAFAGALATPELKARMAALMAEPAPTTPEQFGAFVKAELAKYERVVKASGAKVD